MHADGVRVFVQLGVGSLVAFADDTLKDADQLSITAHTAKRSGLDQLARVAAALWVEGAPVDLARLRPQTGASAAATAPAASGPTVRLSLGAPNVRLPAATVAALGIAATTAPAETAGAGSTSVGGALRSEHEALLAESLAASREVLDALASRPTRPGARRAAAAPAASAPEPPPAPESLRETRRVGLDDFPWLEDHCFYRQADGWTDLADRFPVVPMTTMVEWLAEAANRLEPDLVVVALENVRALRWLPAAPASEITVTAKRTAPGVVEASIDGYARATVRLASALPAGPAPTHAPLVAPRPSPKAPEPLYAEHWMFHGPRFQGVRAIDALGDDGVDGAIAALPTPGAFLDNAGQLYGWWVMATVAQDFLALPQSIERIERFASAPPDGAVVPTTVRITELTDRTVRADLELAWQGSLHVRITGWVDRRFDSDEALWLMLREPEHHLLATPLESGAVLVEERWRDSASRELMARRYLTAAERSTYEGLNPREQRLWLLGRIAAKDAVRHDLWSAGHGPLFPAEITLVDDGPDHVVASGAGAADRRVAIARAEWVGAARLDPTGTGRLTVVPPEPAVDVAPQGRDQRKDQFVVWTDLP